jgi:subtilase family serine protease
VTFSGTAGLVRRAFGSPLLSYDVNGTVRRGAPLAPTLPRSLAARVEGLLSLTDAPRTALNTGFRPVPEDPGLTVLGMHFLTPGDFATIYNTRPLLARGIDGTGVAVAIVGRTHPPETDVRTFRWLYGLKPKAPTLVIHGPDPGDQGSDENGEANLDVEWSGAVAPGADIQLVVAKSTAATDGVDLAAQHVVDRNLAPVLSLSFGECEHSLGFAGAAFYRNLWAQAAAQGITVVVAAGDSGAAGCDLPGASAGGGVAVSGLASTPSNVAVGGTQFAKGSGSHWTGTWKQQGGVSALDYVPEDAWNESGQLLMGLGLWAGGGGPSGLHPKPAWQQAPGVPADGDRDLPDLALAAGIANGYLIQTGGWPSLVGGTSCGAPAFAGIMALLVQRTGQRQGNPNPALYRLAAAQYAGGAARPFHDILLGDNSVPGTDGFHCGRGYDLATGLGSVDATALVEAWPAPPK